MSRDGFRHDCRKNVGKLIRVTWLDATGPFTGWSSRGDVMEHRLERMETVGWLVGVTRDALHLAADRSTKGELYNSVGLIPLGWIQEIERLVVEQGAPRDA